MKAMHSVCILILVLALGQASFFATAGSSSDDANNKEIEQMYYKIFLSSRFSPTIDPDTTQKWLMQLNKQLDDGEKRENVKKLLAFSDAIQPDCNLSDGSGNVLVANFQFFTRNSTPTIKAYIANRLAQMYEQCRELFVLDTKMAVNRLKNSPDFERVSRFKKLVDKEFREGEGFKQDPSEPMRRLVLEQTDGKLPRGRKEFEKLFQKTVSDLCAIIRRELGIMMYFDVLLTPQQIKALRKPVTEWYKVRSVCKEAINEQQAMDKVFKHMKVKSKKEYEIIVSRYERIFEWRLWSLKPEQTLEWLQWLEEKLALRMDINSMERKIKVAKLVELTRRIQQCDLPAAGPLKTVFAEREFGSLTLKRYQKYLRDMMFDHCQAEFAARLKLLEEKIKERWSPEKAEKIFCLKEWIVKKFDPASNNVNNGLVFDMLLEFMDEQVGAPLSPEMERNKFDEQINELAVDPCNDVTLFFNIFTTSDYVLRRNVAKQMDPTVRDSFVFHSICSILGGASTSQRVYERLIARGKRQPSSG